MEEKKDNKILINSKEYEIIAYINVASGNFIVYTDCKMLGDNNVALYINRISEENNEIIFDEVDNDEVMQVISEIRERLVSCE